MKRARFFIVLIAAITGMTLVSGCHSRWGDDKFPERALERLDDHVEDLKLTDSQQKLYQSLRTRLEEDLEKLKSDQVKFRDTFKTTVNREDVTITEFTGMIREKSNDIAPAVSLLMDYLEEFYQILDQNQQQILLKDFRDRMDTRPWR